MSLFLLFQEPFYRAVVASRIVRPLVLPDATEIKILGYADDSNILIRDDESLIEIFRLIAEFEKAMGSKLNRAKSKIYGIGNWKTRDQWPLNEFQVDSEYLYTLGLYHNNNYEKCVDRNWSEIVGKKTFYKSQPHTSFSIFFVYKLQNDLPLQKYTS